MTTMTIEIPDNGDIRNIVIAVSQLKGVAKVTVHEEGSLERIPGLSHTRQERLEALARAEEDIRAGKVYSADEVRAMFPRP